MVCFRISLVFAVFCLLTQSINIYSKSIQPIKSRALGSRTRNDLVKQAKTYNRKASLLVASDVKGNRPFLLSSEPFKYLGPIFFMGMQFSAAKTAVSIVRSRSIGKLSPVPFLSMTVCGFIWALFGLLRKDLTMIVPNSSAAIVGAISAACFHVFDPNPSYQFYLVALAIMSMGTILTAQKNDNLVSLIGGLLAVLMMASPLATLKTVIRDKSTEALPLLPSLTSWANGFSWTAYGVLVAKDIRVIWPNLLGLLFGTIQLFMFVAFGFPPKPLGA